MKQHHLFCKGVIFLLISLIFTSALYAQEKTLSGNISDNSGMSLPGVNVVIKGTSIGTVSDLKGNFGGASK
jgi:hypothetical protein